MIIYSPHIDNTIPAFALKENNQIKIPFSHNIAVPIEAVKSMYVLIKDMNSKYIGYGKSIAIDFNNGYATFLIISRTLDTNLWYKCQIAYSDTVYNNTSAEATAIKELKYSSVAVGRCIEAPEFEINDIYNNTLGSSINDNKVSYIGHFKSSISEPLYQYRFCVKTIEEDILTNTIQDTGWIAASIEDGEFPLDEKGNPIVSEIEFKYNFVLNDELEEYKIYQLSFGIKTVNGYEDEITYRIRKATTYPIVFQGELKAEQDIVARDNGYINISMNSQTPIKGDFELLRSADGQEWDVLTKFHTTSNSDLSKFTWKDFSIEHGVSYIYAIRQYVADNALRYMGARTEKLESAPIIAKFEDMFLTDGNKQLRLRFNPKVSSFKNTILESKLDTIGGQYPFFFRNGTVRYKEIPISGLISYHLDDNCFFMSNEELGIAEDFNIREITAGPVGMTANVRNTNLTSENMVAERKFKLAVLDWLTNGKPKLFRSPAEGNYVVRLMNTSLTPDDKLGRMLHTFTATGYECADNNFASLISNKLIDMPELSDAAFNPLQTWTFTYTEDKASTEEISGDLTNITYIANPPSTTKYIIVDDEKIFNPTGVITIPKAKKIVMTKEMNIGDSLIYYKPLENKNTDPDALIDMIDNWTVQTYEYNNKTETNVSEKIAGAAGKIYTYLSIVCVPTDNNCYIEIDGSRINLGDGRIRTYKNLNGNTSIVISANVHAYITCAVKGGTNQ